jgi:hypothetical protein
MNRDETTLIRLANLIENAQRAGATEQQIVQVVEEELGVQAPVAAVLDDRRAA